MAEYIDKEKAIKSLWDEVNYYEEDTEYDIASGLSRAINVVEKITEEDVVSSETFEQVMWERDLAISQLHDLGLDLGIKNTTLIRKDQALNYLYDAVIKYDDDIQSILTEFTIKIGQGKPFTKQEIEEMLLEN